MRSLLWIPIGIALLSAAAVLGSFYHFSTQPANPGLEKKIEIEIRRGQPLVSIAAELESLGVVASAQRFLWLGKLTRKSGQIKAGEYQVSSTQSPLEIYRTICSGISVSHPFTIPEGYNQFEIAAALERQGLGDAKEYLSLFRDRRLIDELNLSTPAPESLEGYLFPDTYLFQKKMTPRERVLMMVKKFKTTWKERIDPVISESTLNAREVLTLASVIEKETGVADERPMISSVFHNRLKKRMRLQSDPTTIYGIWERFQGNLRKSDLEEKTPYNTYRIDGLPKGPICNPGADAILAAIRPAQTDFLYFVSMNAGSHQFSRTYAEHAAAVRKFQLDPRAREGKSWRNHSTP